MPAHPFSTAFSVRRTAILAQVLGAFIAIGLLALVRPAWLSQPLVVALAQGLAAAFTSRKLDSPLWWQVIHLIFWPLVVTLLALDIPPTWYLAAFLMLVVVFWRVGQTRVPLYLSNAQTTARLIVALPRGTQRFLDIGCGDGRLLATLARTRGDIDFVGIEYAPLPWLWARLRCAGLTNCRVLYGDYWKHPLTPYDVVYAFLSPEPMPRLWVKAQTEMGMQAVLISNSFAVPDIAPEQTIDVADTRATQLFCYRPAMPAAVTGEN